MRKTFPFFSAILVVLCLLATAASYSQDKFSQPDLERDTAKQTKEKFDVARVIWDEILDNHEFVLAERKGHPVSIPLPVVLYSPQRGFAFFLSSKFRHGQDVYNGYKIEHGEIKPVNAKGTVDKRVTVYDFSLTRNVVQMIFAALLLLLLMKTVAKKYLITGRRSAPKGLQNAMEMMITFVRDEVAKPNLGSKYERYLPYLLSIFFFILINNILGLIPLSAKVSGNISFTLVMALISLVVILASTNRHFWSHIIWPPDVPLAVKFILIPVELAGIFIKPLALMIRLFANMIAGHIVIICFISLIFIFSALNIFAGIGFVPVSIAFTVFIFLLEILVVFIQAFIFTNLTAVFIGQAFETAHVPKKPHDPQPSLEGVEKEFAL